MIISLLFDLIAGFLLHKLRPWTLTFRGHQGTLLRYAIGMIAFCVMAPVNVAIHLAGVCDKLYALPRGGWKYWLYLIDVIFVGLLDTAVALGSGVLIGFLSDANKNGNGNGKSIR